MICHLLSLAFFLFFFLFSFFFFFSIIWFCSWRLIIFLYAIMRLFLGLCYSIWSKIAALFSITMRTRRCCMKLRSIALRLADSARLHFRREMCCLYVPIWVWLFVFSSAHSCDTLWMILFRIIYFCDWKSSHRLRVDC
jgi:hypothetical protein